MTEAYREDVGELRSRIRSLEQALAGRDESDSAGELADYDQHQADSATEMLDREQMVGRLDDLRERLRLREMGADPSDRSMPGTGSDPDDVRTPLDDPAPAEDLSAIPMAVDRADVVADPQEDDDLTDLDMPGLVYTGEGGAPQVGQDAPDDPVLDRYRPES